MFYVRCEDLAEIIWLNRQQIRQLEMIHEGLNIPSQVSSYSICICIFWYLYLCMLEMIHEGFNIPSQVSFYNINLSICMCV